MSNTSSQLHQKLIGTVMNRSLIVKSGLLLIMLTIDLVIYSPVRADMKAPVPQNQQQLKEQQLQHLEQQRKQLSSQLSSQKLWEQWRQSQDEQELEQKHRREQFMQQDELRQRQPFEQFPPENQLRQQQRQELEIFKLQQRIREQQPR